MIQFASQAEGLILHAPLGIGFWDPVTDALVDQGLRVRLRPRHATEPKFTSNLSSRGIHVFHNLPGLVAQVLGRDLENSAPAPAPRRFTFEVTDGSNRYLPFSFDADCPASGLFVPECLPHSSPPLTKYVSVFSAVTRAVPSGMATVRAELRNANTGLPAAWALVSAEYRGVEIGQGVADANGKLVLIFSYPEPEAQSPPSGFPWRWPVRLQTAYAALPSATSHPSLCEVLGQPPARLLVEGSPRIELDELQLEFGKELSVTSGSVSHILIEPA